MSKFLTSNSKYLHIKYRDENCHFKYNTMACSSAFTQWNVPKDSDAQENVATQRPIIDALHPQPVIALHVVCIVLMGT